MSLTPEQKIEGNRLELWLHSRGDKTFLHVVIAAGELDEKCKLKQVEIEGKTYDVIQQKFHRQKAQGNLFNDQYYSI